MPRDRCSPSRRAIEVSTGGTSIADETSRTHGHDREPDDRVADEQGAVASRSLQPAAWSAPTARPLASAPKAVATEPTRLYQAKMFVRRSLGVTSLSDACSIGRNGPTSLPDGLRTPSVAATRRTTKVVLPANTTPAAAMRSAPMTRVRRRPIRSAWVVSQEADDRVADEGQAEQQPDRARIEPGRRRGTGRG